VDGMHPCPLQCRLYDAPIGAMNYNQWLRMEEECLSREFQHDFVILAVSFVLCASIVAM
jgi:hypothetical protein